MKIENIQISDCIHYRGFRYGGFGNNIYEDYIVDFAAGVDVNLIRQKFLRRVLAFRGVFFADVLNIQLKKNYPPWIFPWSWSSVMRNNFSYYSSINNPDVICHYSCDGVLASHVNREFGWLERSLEFMRAGYDPDAFGYITVQKMCGVEKTRYLVLDGNHRLASLHAIGNEVVRVKVIAPLLMSHKYSRIWPGVVSGRFFIDDARAIFDRYFIESNLILPETMLANVIENEPLLVSMS